MNGLGRRTIDRRSTRQAAIVDLAVKTKLLASIDAWLLKQPSLDDRRKRALLAVVKERQQLANRSPGTLDPNLASNVESARP